MACEAPLRAYATGQGGRVAFFKRTDWQYKQEPYTGLLVPCGKCILCKQEQARQTSIRIIHEAKQHAHKCFITLTYTPEQTPEFGSLQYKDLTDFLKRVRYHCGPIRYFAVGEYGDKTQRPHYHICLFGQDFVNNRVVYQTTPYYLWRSAQAEQLWGKGMVTIGGMTNETALYCASYVLKKQLGAQRAYVRVDETTGELIRVEQPRAFMSDNLGKTWFNQWNQGLIDHDRVIIDARPQKPPKAYDRWLKETNAEAIQEIKERRQERARNKPQSKDQMRARARNAHARARKRQKSV